MWGKFASRRGEARYPTLWDGRVAAWCPSVTGPTGTRLYDLQSQRFAGTLTNMDPPTDWVRSSGPYALDFDGSNDRVLTGDTVLPSGNSSRSVSAWFRTSIKKNYSVIFRYGTAATSQMFWMGLDNAGQVVVTQFGSALFTSGDRADNRWHNLTVTQIANAYVAHIDGIAVGSNTMTTNTVLTGTASIGASYDQISNGFAGQIDDVSVYNRALTAGEIRALARRRGIAYEARRNQNYGSSGFQAAWARQRTQLIGGGL
jgi:hypothetical protein